MTELHQFKPDPARHPALTRLAALVPMRQRFAGRLLARSAAQFGMPWADAFEQVLASTFPGTQALTMALDAYAALALGSMRMQADFARERCYRARQDAEPGTEAELAGLMLAHFLWPQHYRQRQFFDSAMVPALRASGAASFIEVGVGTGLYSRLLLEQLEGVRGIGIDVSPAATRFAAAQLRAAGLAGRYQTVLADIGAAPLEARADCLVCVEVLEHLADPPALLHALRAMMAPGARAFISAALNAAHPDHVHLYRDAGQLEAQLIEAGFWPEQWLVAPAYRPDAPGQPVPQVAAFIVRTSNQDTRKRL